MNKYKIIALIGEAGSGKDTLLQEILKANSNLHEIISYTTRPPREGEVDGKNYYFIDEETFAEKIINQEMLEATNFNDWFYGTGYGSLDKDKINIGVFNPAGIDIMKTYPDVYIVVYYVSVSAKERLIRQLKREENPDIDEIIRRYKTDVEDFFDLDFHFNEICNETKKDLKNNVKIVLAGVKHLEAKID